MKFIAFPSVDAFEKWSILSHSQFISNGLFRDYSRPSIIRTFSLKTAGLKSEAKASLFRFQKAKAALVRVLTNEEPSNEVGLT